MAHVSPSHDLSIRPVVFLGFLVASAPTALLFALKGGATSLWYGPAANAVLCGSNAVLAMVIATWLARESRLSGHPALAVLTGGYIGMAAIFAAASFVYQPVHMPVIRIMSMVWTMTFGAGAVVFVSIKQMRRRGRELLKTQPLVFHSITLLMFAWLCLGGYQLDSIFQSAAHAAAIRRVVPESVHGAGTALVPLGRGKPGLAGSHFTDLPHATQGRCSGLPPAVKTRRNN